MVGSSVLAEELNGCAREGLNVPGFGRVDGAFVKFKQGSKRRALKRDDVPGDDLDFNMLGEHPCV